ncbi:hypothetical protein HJG60_011841 [Phyllostomus discolor]|uniref:Uncharacterized protein n=1 Tax=Phyllostomus discolor TaxID=89673 RepID=A0A833ZE60_9CHIR|nr:hypothetical protein HJG60_011841 [Phyllostomus discolor]
MDGMEGSLGECQWTQAAASPHLGCSGRAQLLVCCTKGPNCELLGRFAARLFQESEYPLLSGVPAQASGPSAWAAVEITLRWTDTKFRGAVLRLSAKRKALCPSLLALVGRRLLAEGRVRAEGTSSLWRLLPLDCRGACGTATFYHQEHMVWNEGQQG